MIYGYGYATGKKGDWLIETDIGHPAWYDGFYWTTRKDAKRYENPALAERHVERLRAKGVEAKVVAA